MKKLIIIAAIVLLPVAFIALAIYHTNTLRSTQFTWQNRRVPPEFNGFRIVQLSDLHNARFGREQSRLLRMVQQAQPNMIAMTGDMIDEQTRSLAPMRELLAGVRTVAPDIPMFFVDGNHDPQSSFYAEMLDLFRQHNVTVLHGTALLQHNGASMTIAGMGHWGVGHMGNTDIFLAHDPLRFEQFAQHGGGLMLAGHNHGGQVSLPNGQAIIGPRLTLWPEYSSGVYINGDSTMFLSRGLGTSRIPFRLFATPEVAVIELKAE
ncbi:MAG: metallophosphoesterase [Oscillospiraceae bacterium]|nr:metallophosphoesterase [Oscillospiraceae bacterium]